MIVTYFDNARAVYPSAERNITWDQFCVEMSRHRFDIPEKTAAPMFSPAELMPGTSRGKLNVVRVHFGAIDIDARPADEVSMVLDTLHNARLAFIYHTTWSRYKCDANETSGRIIIQLSRPIPVAEWESVWQKLNSLTLGIGDPACKDPSRCYFVPSAPAGTEASAFRMVHAGEPFDPDSFLGRSRNLYQGRGVSP